MIEQTDRVISAVTENDYARASERMVRAAYWRMENGLPPMEEQFVSFDPNGDYWLKAIEAFAAEHIVQRLIGGELTKGDGPDRGVDLVRDEIRYQIKYNSHSFGGFYPKSGTAFVADRGILVVKFGEHRMKLAGWCDQQSYGIHREPKQLRPDNTVMILEQIHLYDIHSLTR